MGERRILANFIGVVIVFCCLCVNADEVQAEDVWIGGGGSGFYNRYAATDTIRVEKNKYHEKVWFITVKQVHDGPNGRIFVADFREYRFDPAGNTRKCYVWSTYDNRWNSWGLVEPRNTEIYNAWNNAIVPHMNDERFQHLYFPSDDD